MYDIDFNNYFAILFFKFVLLCKNTLEQHSR